MPDYDLANLVLQSICPNNAIICDDMGLPSVMVFIPKFKLSDVMDGAPETVHPAFIVNGKEIPGFWYSKYEGFWPKSNMNLYSLPGKGIASSPGSISTIKTISERKGRGWHASTMAEWAAIALWCKKNGTMPRGNNTFGRDSAETLQKAVQETKQSDGKTQRIKTGTGPETWTHDGTAAGIHDLNGNMAEYQAGFRFVWGEIQVMANNDAADPANSWEDGSACWRAINAADGSLVDPECKTTDTTCKTSGATVKLNYVGTKWTYSTGITTPQSASGKLFSDLSCDSTISEAAKWMLRALAMLPTDGAASTDYGNSTTALQSNAAERVLSRGGTYNSGSGAGVFSISGGFTRTGGSTAQCGRCAYIPELREET